MSKSILMYSRSLQKNYKHKHAHTKALVEKKCLLIYKQLYLHSVWYNMALFHTKKTPGEYYKHIILFKDHFKTPQPTLIAKFSAEVLSVKVTRVTAKLTNHKTWPHYSNFDSAYSEIADLIVAPTLNYQQFMFLHLLCFIRNSDIQPQITRIFKGNSPDKLRHPRSDAYSAQQVLLNKQQIWWQSFFFKYGTNSILSNVAPSGLLPFQVFAHSQVIGNQQKRCVIQPKLQKNK